MDDMTWMSSFYESPFQLSKLGPAAWSQAAPAGLIRTFRAFPLTRSLHRLAALVIG